VGGDGVGGDGVGGDGVGGDGVGGDGVGGDGVGGDGVGGDGGDGGSAATAAWAAWAARAAWAAWAAGAAWAAWAAGGSGSGSSKAGHLHVSARLAGRSEAVPPLRQLHRVRHVDDAPHHQPASASGTGSVHPCAWVRVWARARAATRRRPRWAESARSAAWKMSRGDAKQRRYGQWMQPSP